jgi:uncharacterized membrane protein (DUF2068 family)
MQGQPGIGGAPDNGMQSNSSQVPSGSGLMSIMRILQYVLYALVIVCGLIAFGGLWTWRRWGSVMAVVTSVIVTVMSVVSLFGMFSTVVLIESIVRMLIALAVVALVLMPGSRAVETVME